MISVLLRGRASTENTFLFCSSILILRVSPADKLQVKILLVSSRVWKLRVHRYKADIPDRLQDALIIFKRTL